MLFPGSGCTVLKNCVDRGKVADSIKVFMGPVEQMPRFLRMGENRHSTLNFSQGNGFYSTYFRF